MGNKVNSVNLRDIFLGLQQQMIATLSTDREVLRHPGAKGEATELHWLQMVGGYLPRRYCVDKAFVLDCDGRLSDEIDVVIYDRQYSPFLFNQGGAKYIPSESVYAVFEVRPTLNAGNVAYAGEKAASVRELRRTSAPIAHAGGRFDPIEPPRIIAGILTLESEWTPPLGESLVGALHALGAPARQLDLGCSLRHGSFEVTYNGAREPTLEVSREDASLIFFFTRLLARLQAMGTVAALDFREYSRVL